MQAARTGKGEITCTIAEPSAANINRFQQQLVTGGWPACRRADKLCSDRRRSAGTGVGQLSAGAHSENTLKARVELIYRSQGRQCAPATPWRAEEQNDKAAIVGRTNGALCIERSKCYRQGCELEEARFESTHRRVQHGGLLSW